MDLYARRKLINNFNMTISVITTAIGVIFLAWILIVLIIKGVGSINWALFTEMTPPPGSAPPRTCSS